MLKNKKEIFRLIILLTGCVFLILPHFTGENEFIYTISPWIYLTCFIFYERTMERKTEWGIFIFLLLTSIEIRYQDFLGGYDALLHISSIFLLIVLTLGVSVPFLMDRIYLKCGRGLFSITLFPFLRVLVERFIFGQQFNLSTTQFGNKWLIQSEAYFGDYFISFIVAFIPSILIYVLLNRKDKKAYIRGGLFLLPCLLVFMLGMVRYHTSPVYDNEIKMAYASGPQKPYYENPSSEDADYEENADYLKRTVREAAEGGARLIAYAEEAFVVEGDERERLIKEAKAVAAENNIYILLSLDYYDDRKLGENLAVFIDNNGDYISDYVKTNLIPVVEDDDYAAGDGIIPADHVKIDGRDMVISYTICYDATFSDYLLTMDSETDLFINPSWDWKEIVDLNYRMQGISAIQCGVVLFKPTVDGWSVVTDPYGKVSFKESTLGTDYEEVHFVPVVTGRISTVYQKIYKYVNPVWTILVIIAILDFIRVMVLKILTMRAERNRLKEDYEEEKQDEE